MSTRPWSEIKHKERLVSEPKIIEVNVQYSGGGKVAVVDYGKLSSEYHASLSERWAIPSDWTPEQAREFEVAKLDEMRGTLDPIIQEEQDTRLAHANWN